jgi:hypothetical protein
LDWLSCTTRRELLLSESWNTALVTSNAAFFLQEVAIPPEDGHARKRLGSPTYLRELIVP